MISPKFAPPALDSGMVRPTSSGSQTPAMVRKLRVEGCALILKVLWNSAQCFQRHPWSSRPFEVFHLVRAPAITWGVAQSSTWEGEDSMSFLWDQSSFYVNLLFAWNYFPTTGYLGTDVTDVKVWLQFGRHLCHPKRIFMNTLVDWSLFDLLSCYLGS